MLPKLGIEPKDLFTVHRIYLSVSCRLFPFMGVNVNAFFFLAVLATFY